MIAALCGEQRNHAKTAATKAWGSCNEPVNANASTAASIKGLGATSVQALLRHNMQGPHRFQPNRNKQSSRNASFMFNWPSDNSACTYYTSKYPMAFKADVRAYRGDSWVRLSAAVFASRRTLLMVISYALTAPWTHSCLVVRCLTFPDP